ncbi:hypothetical protein QC764_501470 [Podospora pseudoanserina]|uniref:Uncharacterized protein n=1 Tax=Podospora pseudoanserina TaxID=2609844 RepID=A0ABR0I4C0_9PEZI|nr:hypothetical protein QC764_501470 [Podospora pseudoanserina]
MPPGYYASSTTAKLALRDGTSTSPPTPEETSGVVILLAVLGSAVFALLFFWAVKRCYWDAWWYSGTYYPISAPRPVEVVWAPDNSNDYCSTCSGESHITVPSTSSPSSSPSLSVKPGASAGAIRLISKDVGDGLEDDETSKRNMIMPNDATNNEPRGGMFWNKGTGAKAGARTCVDLKQLDSGPFSSTVMSQCGTGTRGLQEQKQVEDSKSCILM